MILVPKQQMSGKLIRYATSHPQVEKTLMSCSITTLYVVSVITSLGVVTTQASAQPVLFVFDNEQLSGNCHTLPGARLELSAAPGGYSIHYVAQMKTDQSVFGDVWHVYWQFKDAAGNVILTSQQANLPEGTSMHPQFDPYNIDYHGSIGPDTEPHITQVLSA